MRLAYSEKHYSLLDREEKGVDISELSRRAKNLAKALTNAGWTVLSRGARHEYFEIRANDSVVGDIGQIDPTRVRLINDSTQLEEFLSNYQP
jgi:hypothetical protein